MRVSGSPLAARLGDAGVEAVDVAHADLRHLLVAVLHLAHRPFERDDRLLRVGDDGRQQMRDAVVDRELEHLRVDHDEPALLGLHAIEERQDHGVDRDRLARAGGAGDQEMRHAGEVDDDRLAADRLAERDGEAVLRLLEILAGEQFAQIDRLAALVRQLDADRVAALHHGDAGGDGRHRAGDVVGEADHPRGLDAGRGLELVEGDDRARAHVDDLALDAEIVEDAFEQARVLLQRVLEILLNGRFSARPAWRAAASIQSPRGEKANFGCASAAARAPASAGRRARPTRGAAGGARARRRALARGA